MRFPFVDYVAVLGQTLAARDEIVDRLEHQLFSGRGKAMAQSGDRESIADVLETCVFEARTSSPDALKLKAQLTSAHLADGFEPAAEDGYSRHLDPVELVLRACHYWDADRWPGRAGRIAYTHGLYAAVILRQLEHLSLRIWDPSTALGASEGNDAAHARLQHIQRLLDALNAPAGTLCVSPLVRDARWLIQTAQGPLTRHLRPYFITADKVSHSLSERDRLDIHAAGAVLAGGHLRSQLRHLALRTGWAFDDPHLLALTRSSNSMDMALLVRDLIPLMDAYRAAAARGDATTRLALADAILQGLSADPELLLTRLDLLAPSTMIEDLFVEGNDPTASRYTAMGAAHRECLTRYAHLIGDTATSLLEDSAAFDPAHALYSPLGIVYGFCADLLSNAVLSTMRAASSSALSLEDMFNSRDRLDEKRDRAHQWERLPKRAGEPAPFEHSTDWASRMYARLAGALDARAARPAGPNASMCAARLYVVPRGVAVPSPDAGVLPAAVVTAQEHCLTSDATLARATGATPLPAERLIADRAEGRLLACVQCDGAWFGVSKILLTLFASQGKDALIAHVPRPVIDVLEVVYPETLVVVE